LRVGRYGARAAKALAGLRFFALTLPDLTGLASGASSGLPGREMGF
jgi:hypothetical protein